MDLNSEREAVVFSAARRLPVKERAFYLEGACAGDAHLRRQIEELLEADESAGAFLAELAAGAGGRVRPGVGLDPEATVGAAPGRSERPGDTIDRYKLMEQIGEGGFGAFGYDIAPSAIRLAAEATRAAQLSAEFQVADFLRTEPPFLFDWIFEHTLFCAIQPNERDAYVRAVLSWLKPQGQYLAVNYLIPDRDGPPFGTTREELRQRFSPHFELLDEWVPRSYPNRTGLELMLWWSRKPEVARIDVR